MDFSPELLAEAAAPLYKIHRYTDQIYKVVKFKRSGGAVGIGIKRKEAQHNDKKIDQSLSRTRRIVLELALCNNWEYFCTFTVSPDNYDRKDLDKFHKDFTQFIRDQRKKYSVDIRFVLVPELHKDGSWHMHGLISGLDPALEPFFCLDRKGVRSVNGRRLPKKLIQGKYKCWFDYWQKFGFCSLGKIQNKTACAFYVAKYISKQIDGHTQPVGSHLYYASRGLNRSTPWGDVYQDSTELDKYLQHNYEFCSVGMTSLQDDLNWTFAGEYIDIPPMQLLELPDPEDSIPEVDDFWTVAQTSFF